MQISFYVLTCSICLASSFQKKFSHKAEIKKQSNLCLTQLATYRCNTRFHQRFYNLNVKLSETEGTANRFEVHVFYFVS